MTLREQGLAIEGFDFNVLSEPWRADVPPDAKLLFLSPFGDSFYCDAHGAVWNLDLALGQINHIATDEAEFRGLLDDTQQREQWTMPSLLDELESRGLQLKTGECFGFREPPFAGGGFDADNIEPIDLHAYYELAASLHQALNNP